MIRRNVRLWKNLEEEIKQSSVFIGVFGNKKNNPRDILIILSPAIISYFKPKTKEK